MLSIIEEVELIISAGTNIHLMVLLITKYVELITPNDFKYIKTVL